MSIVTQLAAPAAFGRDDSSVISCGRDGTAKVWDAATGLEFTSLATFEKPVSSLAFSQDGSRLASAGDDVRLWQGQSRDTPAQELAYRRGKAEFQTAVARKNLHEAPTEYARQFWRSQLLKHGPPDAALLAEMQRASGDPACRRLYEAVKR